MFLRKGGIPPTACAGKYRRTTENSTGFLGTRRPAALPARRLPVWAVVGLLIWPGSGIALVVQELPDNSGAPADSSRQSGGPGGFRFPLPAELVSQGWIALFDGSTLYGWRAESDANWRVDAGCLVADQGSPGLLRTTSQFSDFDLHVEFNAPSAANSGVLVRTSPRPGDRTSDGYEISIAPVDDYFPTGSIIQRQVARIPEGGQTVDREGGWQSLDIRIVGGRIEVRLNDQLVASTDDRRPLGRGYVALRFDGRPVRFRSIRLKPLNATSLYNHRDTGGWRQAGDCGVQIGESGDLLLSGGPGRLESVGRFGDFVMQLECRLDSGQNSGVFYRCVPGEPLNGYEIQLDNSARPTDPAQPANAGTGAIFRRTTARRLAAADDTWFALTAAVCGPHVSVWVNGYQVTDWTDQRPPDPNPRRGSRLQPGSLMLQGHDRQTRVRFRQIEAAELRPRRTGQ